MVDGCCMAETSDDKSSDSKGSGINDCVDPV